MLILALAPSYCIGGQTCAGVDPEVFTSRAEALAEHPGADVYFIEHLSMETVDAQPGDLVIRMESVSQAQAEQAERVPGYRCLTDREAREDEFDHFRAPPREQPDKASLTSDRSAAEVLSERVSEIAAVLQKWDRQGLPPTLTAGS